MTKQELIAGAGLYFSKENMSFWGSEIISPPDKNNIFIEAIDSFDQTERIYKVARLNSDHSVETLMDISDRNFFNSADMADAYRNVIADALKNKDGISKICLDKSDIPNRTYILEITYNNAQKELIKVSY